MQVYAIIPPQNIFTYLELDYSLLSSIQRNFYGTVYGLSEMGTEWENVSKITKSFNTYLSNTPRKTKNLTSTDIYR